MLQLIHIKNSDTQLRANMAIHYSQPKGFVGRNICYAVVFNNVYYGAIVGGSATLHLAGRNEFFNIDKSHLKSVINNIFFHIEKVDGKYPTRNFAKNVIAEFRRVVVRDWQEKYGDRVIGLETLVELPRTGECYIRDGWELVGQTVGYTCKRVAGTGTDSWTGKRVWNTKELKPKLVFCIRVTDNT